MAASLAIHGALLALAFTLLPGGAEAPRPAPQLTVVDVELPPRPEEPPQLLAAITPGTGGGTPAPARSTVPAGLRGRRGHATSPHAPPPANDPFAELAISYDTGDRAAPRPGPGAGDDGEGPGAGARGTGRGLGIPAPLGDGGAGGLRVPAAPPSRARGPRPKHEYARWAFRAPAELADSKILLQLAIDAHGRISDVRVLKGTGSRIDDRVVAHARSYEFHPALDHTGEPTAGVYRWEFVLEAQVDFSAALNR